MSNVNLQSSLVTATALAFGLGLTQAADAATLARSWSVQGPHGHGYVATSTTNRGGGRLTDDFTRTYNNGKTATSTGSISRSGNGSVTREASHTGIRGNTQTESSTIYRTDDGFGRTREVSTSNGRSASETGSVSFAPGSMTVDRSITTGSGASVSQAATYTRGN
jgi:hypothetical protein